MLQLKMFARKQHSENLKKQNVSWQEYMLPLATITLNKVLELKEAQDTAAAAAMQRKTNEERQLELKVKNIREKGNDPASWNSKELKTMVKWFKWSGDAPLPNWKGKLL